MSGSGGGGGGGVTQACVLKGSCNAGAALTCASAATCGAGQICCLDLGASDGSTPTTSTCKTSCAPPVDAGDPAGPVIQLCGSDAECKGGAKCLLSQFGVKICRKPSGGGGGGGH